MPTQELSDKGLSIFAFAAYHQLSSGEKVAEVVLKDGTGHSADPDGVRETEALGLIEVHGDRAMLTERGMGFLDSLLQQVRGTAKLVERPTAVA